MFKRLILEDSSTYYVIVAFVTAASIFLIITWRAIHMPSAQVERFARLPLADAETNDHHEA